MMKRVSASRPILGPAQKTIRAPKKILKKNMASVQSSILDRVLASR